MSTDHDPEELREHSHLNTTSTPSVVDEPLIPEFHLKGFEDSRDAANSPVALVRAYRAPRRKNRRSLFWSAIPAELAS